MFDQGRTRRKGKYREENIVDKENLLRTGGGWVEGGREDETANLLNLDVLLPRSHLRTDVNIIFNLFHKF